jgi:hypothetical protein
LEESHGADHHRGGDRNTQVPPGASLGMEGPTWHLDAHKSHLDAGKSHLDAGKSRWLYDADVEDVVALEGLAAAVADDAAHHLRGQLARKPHAGGGATGVVLATNEPNRFPGQWLGEPSIVSALHVRSIG